MNDAVAIARPGGAIGRVGVPHYEGVAALPTFYKNVMVGGGPAIWCPPSHKHWHGASQTTAMTHIAIQESLNGSPVEWMEP